MKTVFLLFVAAVIIGGVALYALIGGGPEPVTSNTNVSEVEPVSEVSDAEPETFVGTGSLERIMQLGPNIECQITHFSPELAEPVEGTYFVNGERVRGDFLLTAPELGGTFVSSIIFNGTTLYTWSEIAGETYGVKVAVERFGATVDGSVREPIPADVAVDYDCRVWENIDGSIFLPPGDVLFQDANQIFESGMEYGTIYEEGEF